jgi:sigma-B regulation protein RsbU (phosphoserine phosphatase)
MASSTIAAAQAPVPVLVLQNGNEKKTITLARTPFTIGRSTDRDLVLNDARVSRVHAAIDRTANGDYELRDEGSRFGTTVNAQSVKSHVLKDGDEIQFGGSGGRVTFRTTVASEPAWLTSSSSIKPASELQQLNLFLQAARSLNTTRVLDDVLRTLLDYTLKITGAGRAYVFLRDANGELRLTQGRDSKGNLIANAAGISRSVLEECANSSVEFLIGDTARHDALADRNSIVALDLRTVIAIPLRTVDANEILGVLYLDSHFATHNLSGCSPEILRAIATEAARVVENARLVQTEQEARQYQQELAIASSIQQRLINAKLPQTNFLSVEARTMPCKEVGGDFYDAVLTPNGVAVVLADVSGKGISAALLASMIQGMLYAEMSAGIPLASAVASLNKFLCERMGGQKYATLLVAEIKESGATEMVCCGHVPPFLIREGTVTTLTEGCMPVGLVENARFASNALHLQSGDRLIFVTDGATEAANEQNEEFGVERLEECARSHDFMGCTFASLRTFLGPVPMQDDCSLVEIRFQGRPSQA